MTETILSWTELPNLHPALVHFPIAFVVLALLFELVATVRGRLEWLDKAAVATWAAAGLGAWAAYWAGERAADSLSVPPSVQRHLNTHSDWGHYSLYVVGAAAILRLALSLWRPAPRDGRLWPVVFLLAGLVATGVVFRTADLGGGLVYGHGLAVRAPSESPPPSPETAATDGRPEEPGREGASPQVRRADDGAITWTPEPGGGSALGSILTGLDGEPPAGAEPIAQEGAGLLLRIDGEGYALLRDPCGDVQVEADLVLDDFRGSVGLVHHVREDGSGGVFRVRLPEGRAELATRQENDIEILDEAELEAETGARTLAVSGAGRHFRGLVDGDLVTHGHQPALPDGRCGLWYDGAGQIRLTELRVFPID